MPLRGLYGLSARRRGDHFETGIAQGLRGKQLKDVRLVLDDQQLGVRAPPFIVVNISMLLLSPIRLRKS